MNVRKTLDQTSIWFVPMVNPDGVTLVQKGYKSAKNPAEVMSINGFSTDFSSWKANIRGVDLNRQYPADWENVLHNTGKPSPKNYKGTAPLTEPEAKAMANFVHRHNFKAAANYHSSGEILYWYFNQTTHYSRDYALARKIGQITGYSLVDAVYKPSAAFQDWFIYQTGYPGFTVEISPYVVEGEVPLHYFDRIWSQNKTIGLVIADESRSF
jgi:murein tripeptide amidase MpaA